LPPADFDDFSIFIPFDNPMPLQYLDFDYSEDEEGTSTWDAIANVAAAHLPDLRRELAAVLAWATTEFGPLQGPVEAGGLWDYDLQCERQGHPLQALHYDPETGQLQPAPDASPGERLTLCLSLSGKPAFADAFRVRFDMP